MTTNDKPVCYQIRCLDARMPGVWGSHDTAESRDALAKSWDERGVKYETRDLYARPQPAAPQVPEHPALLLGDLRAAAAGMVGAIDDALAATPPAAKPEPLTFTDVDPEAQHLADADHLNCPSCGGSGHVGDVVAAKPEQPKPAGDVEAPQTREEAVALAGKLLAMLENISRIIDEAAERCRLAAQPAQGEGEK